ncbi:hypothetical protein G5I_03159 [Acromyrmex echinatior]|uniref:Uncharacterized protein n=1 Tax=Acromyrmex echinatior TaxID=103372 RepID=F4WC85_ACREC|nr:hypothetical protein G5I_03159 [Acromyrmex echinatior]
MSKVSIVLEVSSPQPRNSIFPEPGKKCLDKNDNRMENRELYVIPVYLWKCVRCRMTKLITGRVAQFCVTPVGNVNTRVILCKSNLITAHPDDTHTIRGTYVSYVGIVSNLKFPYELVTGISDSAAGSAIRPQSGNYFLFGSIPREGRMMRVLIMCDPKLQRNIDFESDIVNEKLNYFAENLRNDRTRRSCNLHFSHSRYVKIFTNVCIHGEDFQTVNVRFGSPVLRVFLRSMLPDVFVTAIAYEHHHHDHTADHGAKSEPI